jgi:hypothetical protein
MMVFLLVLRFHFLFFYFILFIIILFYFGCKQFFKVMAADEVVVLSDPCKCDVL